MRHGLPNGSGVDEFTDHYDKLLTTHLGLDGAVPSVSRLTDDGDEDVHDWGEFVYSGKDAQSPTTFSASLDENEGRDHQEKLSQVLETSDTTFKKLRVDDHSSLPTTPLLDAAKAPSGMASPASSRQSHLSRTGSLYDISRRPAHLLSKMSRLRSNHRFPSTSSINTLRTDARFSDIGSSRFDALSRRSSSTQKLSDRISAGSRASSLIDIETHVASFNPLRWTPLRRISAKLFSSRASTKPNDNDRLGQPTVLTASAYICVGTTNGWVLVYDYSQALKCVCGNDMVSKTSGSVTALALSLDHTFLAVGHSSGFIHLYALAKPNQAARTVKPVPRSLVDSGKAEGHLVGSSIRHVGFLSDRHTAIISSDNYGLAFYHSLGQVLGLASVDIVRLNGQYPAEDVRPYIVPDITTAYLAPADTLLSADSIQPKASRTTLFDMSPLPLGAVPHISDKHTLAALVTSNKLIIATVKSKPQALWKLAKVPEDCAEDLPAVGSITWLPGPEAHCDPVLAFSWGSRIHFVHVCDSKATANGSAHPVKLQADRVLSFRHSQTISSPDLITRLLWLNRQMLAVQTLTSIDLWNIEQAVCIGRAPLDLRTIQDPDSSIQTDGNESAALLRAAFNVVAYKGKLFALALADVRVATTLSWADRLIHLVDAGNLLQAIELATLYYRGLANASSLGLPSDETHRHDALRPKLYELMHASTDYTFSEATMADTSHSRQGVDMTDLFEGLVDACLRACVALEEFEYSFETLYERFEEAGILAVYLGRVAISVASHELSAVPTGLSHSVICQLETASDWHLLERFVVSLQTTSLDIDQVLTVSRKHNLIDLFIYVYCSALQDWTTPLLLLLSRLGKSDSSFADDDIFRLILRPFAENDLDAKHADSARRQIFEVLVHKQAESFSNLDCILQFDGVAFLDILDECFECSYIPVTGSASRQTVINALVQHSTSVDDQAQKLLIDMFVARNYSKFHFGNVVSLSPPECDAILDNLLGTDGCETIEDRQLSCEFLLSVYTPSNTQKLEERLGKAQFYRILCSRFQSARNWLAFANVLQNVVDRAIYLPQAEMPSSQLTECLTMAIATCQQADVTDEQWLALFRMIISAIDQTRAGASSVDFRKHLVQILEGFQSQTNTKRASLPSLIQQLLDSPEMSQTSFKAFRDVFETMARAYASESEVLTIAKSLYGSDVFKQVGQLAAGRRRGWKADETLCMVCRKQVWGAFSGEAFLQTSNSVSDLVQQAAGRTKLNVRRKESLKGKEVNWPQPNRTATVAPNDASRLPYQDLVAARSGQIFHRSCFLAHNDTSHELN